MYNVEKVYKVNSGILLCRIWLLPGYIQEKCLKHVLCGENYNIYS